MYIVERTPFSANFADMKNFLVKRETKNIQLYLRNKEIKIFLFLVYLSQKGFYEWKSILVFYIYNDFKSFSLEKLAKVVFFKTDQIPQIYLDPLDS